MGERWVAKSPVFESVCRCSRQLSVDFSGRVLLVLIDERTIQIDVDDLGVERTDLIAGAALGRGDGREEEEGR